MLVFLRKGNEEVNILFITICHINLERTELYADQVNALANAGHRVFVVAASNQKDKVAENKPNIKIAYVSDHVGKKGLVAKGLDLLRLPRRYISAIKQHFGNESIDLVLYATPPITLNKVIQFCKKEFECKAYLMLKDIFPQNAVDIELMSKRGLTAPLYRYFRTREKALYKISDRIGCMSQANMDYLLTHNKLDASKVEIYPNSMQIRERQKTEAKTVLAELGIQEGNTVFLYGGNLGKPQGLDFLVKGVQECETRMRAHFVIVGKGTEKERVFSCLRNKKNVTLLDYLAPDKYDQLCAACDVGMVFLDPRFTIPNYPSRALTYLHNEKPILACTDANTDFATLVEKDAECGKWCLNGDMDEFLRNVKWFVDNEETRKEMGMNGRTYLETHFDVTKHIGKLIALCERK